MWAATALHVPWCVGDGRRGAGDGGLGARDGRREAGASEIRLVFGSCVDDPASPVWDTIRAARPDAVVLLGDTIYLPPPVAPGGRHADAYPALVGRLFGDPGFVRLTAAAPLYATWDDHDFAGDDADGTDPSAGESLRHFRVAWRRNPPPPAGLEGSVAFVETFRKGGVAVRVVVPDSRTFRRAPAGGSPGVLFGGRQLGVIGAELSREATFTILASSTPLLAGGPDDAGAYPNEKERIIAAVAGASSPTVVVSGDRHAAEVYTLPSRGPGRRTTAEFVSSPLTAAPRPAEEALVGRGVPRRWAAPGRKNFLLIRTSEERTLLEFVADDGTSLGRFGADGSPETASAHGEAPGRTSPRRSPS